MTQESKKTVPSSPISDFDVIPQTLSPMEKLEQNQPFGYQESKIIIQTFNYRLRLIKQLPVF